MYMYFYQSATLTFLFKPLTTSHIGVYIVFLIVAFLMALALDSISYVHFMFKNHPRLNPAVKIGGSVLIYFFQTILAFWVMLLVMSYNALMIVSIILGLSVGYSIFGLKKLNDKARMMDCSDVVHEKCCA